MSRFFNSIVTTILTGILTAIGFCIGQNLVEKYYERKERQNIKISNK